MTMSSDAYGSAPRFNEDGMHQVSPISKPIKCWCIEAKLGAEPPDRTLSGARD